MSNRKRRILILCGLAGLGVLGAVAGAIDDVRPDEQQIRELADRLKRLEQSIGMESGELLVPTLTSRLQRGEEGLSEIKRRFDDAGTGLPERQLEHMQRDLKKLTTGVDDLTSRISAIELLDRSQEELDREVRQMSSGLKSVQQQLSGLERRLTKLETK